VFLPLFQVFLFIFSKEYAARQVASTIAAIALGLAVCGNTSDLFAPALRYDAHVPQNVARFNLVRSFSYTE
jgi:hypothetical protein